jgi:hypothetical protein
MSPETDRIPVPTNGKGPHPIAPVAPGPAADPPEPGPATIAFTPTQLAVGFGIIASLIVLLARRMRRRR